MKIKLDAQALLEELEELTIERLYKEPECSRKQAINVRADYILNKLNQLAMKDWVQYQRQSIGRRKYLDWVRSRNKQYFRKHG